jgi:hypothetical protein
MNLTVEEEENELLGKYRQLNNEGKAKFIEWMKALLNEQEKGKCPCTRKSREGELA